MVCIENADCTSGIIYFEDDEMTNVEMLCCAPQGCDRHLTRDIETAQWILRWRLKDVEIYRASQRETVAGAKPVRMNRELMAAKGL